MTVTTGGNCKTVVKMAPWSRHVDNFPTVDSYHPVQSRTSLPLHFTIPLRRGNVPLLPHADDKFCAYRPVPSTNSTVPSSKTAHTVPSRRENLSLPSNPAVKTCPYRPAPPFIAVPFSLQEYVTVKMPCESMNSYYS